MAIIYALALCLVAGLGAFFSVDYIVKRVVPNDKDPTVAAEKAELDDPAVAACEYYLRKQEIINPGQYQRLHAKISGDQVTIRYQIASLNVEPTHGEGHCVFEADDQGKFTIKPPPILGLRECQQTGIHELAQHGLKAGEAATSAEEWQSLLAPFKERIAFCKEVLQRAAAWQQAHVAKVYIPLAIREIYPIEPEKTALEVPMQLEQ